MAPLTGTTVMFGAGEDETWKRKCLRLLDPPSRKRSCLPSVLFRNTPGCESDQSRKKRLDIGGRIPLGGWSKGPPDAGDENQPIVQVERVADIRRQVRGNHGLGRRVMLAARGEKQLGPEGFLSAGIADFTIE